MRRVARGLGWMALLLAGLLGMAGVASWPPEGLMFALPFVFLIPAVGFGAAGALLLFFGKPAGDDQE